MRSDTKLSLKRKLPHRLYKLLVDIYRGLFRFKTRICMTFMPDKMTYYCPCCGLKLKSFIEGDYKAQPEFYDLSLFEKTRQDVRCPCCSSLPRHRILALWCSAHKDVLDGKNILYFAPENGMVRWLRSNRIRYQTADLFDPDADLKLDIQATGLPDDSYDVIICNHVLEHAGDYKTALNELKRILRPEGTLICSFPVSPDVELLTEDPDVKDDAGRLERYGQSDHVRLFGMKAEKLIEEQGFDVNFIDGRDYPDETVPVTGPSLYDINRLYLCRIRKGEK